MNARNIRSRPPQGGRLLGVLILALVLTAISLSHFDRPDDSPLPWDMAHHTLRVNRMANALRALDFEAARAELRYWDVYPPAIYLGTGLIQSVLKSEALAWRVAGCATWLLLAVAGLLGFGRRRAARSALLLLLVGANGFLLSLSGQRMLDFPATAAAVLALAAMVRVERSLPSTLLAGAALSLALLSKANAGLPVAAVGVCFAGIAWLRRDRDRSLPLLISVCGALAIWALFTSWQDHGWQAFLAFARNRANSAELSPLTRAGRYLELLSSWLGGWWIAAVFLACVALGLRTRSRFAWAAFLYAAASWAAIAIHPYFLARNLTSAALALCVPAACGCQWLFDRSRGARFAWTLGSIVIVVQLFFVATPRAREESRRQMPPALSLLAEPSRQLEHWFAAGAGRTLVIGSFRELGKPWIQSLAERRPDSAVTVDLYYPLQAARGGRDARWEPRYAQIFERHVSDFVEVFVIRAASESTWRSGDYKAWNAYKENYARCVERSEALLLEQRVNFPDAGIELSRFSRAFTPIEFESGWRAPEAWGRWMAEPVATLRLPSTPDGARLVAELAPDRRQSRPIRLRVSGVGEETTEWMIEGEPWRFQRFEFSIGSALAGGSLRLELLDPGTDEALERRLLAVQTIGVVASASELGSELAQ